MKFLQKVLGVNVPEFSGHNPRLEAIASEFRFEYNALHHPKVDKYTVKDYIYSILNLHKYGHELPPQVKEDMLYLIKRDQLVMTPEKLKELAESAFQNYQKELKAFQSVQKNTGQVSKHSDKSPLALEELKPALESGKISLLEYMEGIYGLKRQRLAGHNPNMDWLVSNLGLQYEKYSAETVYQARPYRTEHLFQLVLLFDKYGIREPSAFKRHILEHFDARSLKKWSRSSLQATQSLAIMWLKKQFDKYDPQIKWWKDIKFQFRSYNSHNYQSFLPALSIKQQRNELQQLQRHRQQGIFNKLKITIRQSLNKIAQSKIKGENLRQSNQ